MALFLLGITCFRHDSAAVLLRDGAIVAAAQEERFSRRKFDARFPAAAARWCLAHAGLASADLAAVAVCEPPASPIAGGDPRAAVRRDLGALIGDAPPVVFVALEQARAAAAFFASPFQRAAVLCMDGAGERIATSAWCGDGRRLTPLWAIKAPHALGLLYSAFTHYCGFAVGAGEYKLMGLAPYGEPTYARAIRERLIDIDGDGQFRLDPGYFKSDGDAVAAGDRLADLFGGAPRAPDAPLEQRHMDVARSVQVVTEEAVLHLGRGLHRMTGAEHLCLAGGVALNCVANGRLLRDGTFRDIWVQPAAGDAGTALGAALWLWHETLGKPRAVTAGGDDAMAGGFLGPAFDDGAIAAALDAAGATSIRLKSDTLCARVAALLAQGNVVGWVQGRMEFGPRALGARSILADPRDPAMQSRLNRKIKFRESFRPFAPAVLAERLGDWFAHDRPSPYMLFTAPVAEPVRLRLDPARQALTGLARLAVPRSRIPAVTHVDYSARIQTVHAATNPRFHCLLRAFENLTGCPVLINTSFNVRDEPIVCTPADAWRCFLRTEMDYLCVGNHLLARAGQPVALTGG
ncbi:MAG TPA: carbamoyltransferase C-terminal domain-containing protein [Rhodospirillales bacterium]|nr:carbamoyltransferase C-terminal domain-containing protein [Rhodospirillales bacterium]